MQTAIEATGSDVAPFGALGLAALRGSEADVSALVDATLGYASLRGQGLAISAAGWASAVLNNGLGRYEAALAAAQRSTEISYELGFSNWAMVELIEAAALSGANHAATGAYRQLAEQARAAGDVAAADRFDEIRRDEMKHRAVFQAALQRLQGTGGAGAER